jgi:hypothetical protein
MQQPREVRMSAGQKRVIATWMLLGRCHAHEQHALIRVRMRLREPLLATRRNSPPPVSKNAVRPPATGPCPFEQNRVTVSFLEF